MSDKLYIYEVNIKNATFTIKVPASEEYEAKIRMQEEVLKNMVIEEVRIVQLEKSNNSLWDDFRNKLKEILVL